LCAQNQQTLIVINQARRSDVHSVGTPVSPLWRNAKQERFTEADRLRERSLPAV
jgi:hypothetical protein